MFQLDRFTTEYVDSQDRIRLRVHSVQGEVLELWLTQRLLGRLVVHCCTWLETLEPAAPLASALHHSFAQQAAHQALQQDPVAPVAPLSTEGIQAPGVLVCSVDVHNMGAQLSLDFKDADAQVRAQAGLQAQALRQWLAIVQSQYGVAEWPMHGWPEWLQESATLPAPVLSKAPLLH